MISTKDRMQHKQAKTIAYARAKQKRNLTTVELLRAGQKAGYFVATHAYVRLRDDKEVIEELYDYCLDILAGRKNPIGKARKR